MDLAEYGGTLAARAVMFANTCPAQIQGARKFSSPQYYSTTRSLKLRTSSLSAAFPSHNVRETITCTLPLLHLIRPKGLPPTKMATITELGSFPLRGAYSKVAVTKTIGQDDMFDEEEEEQLLEAACREVREEEQGVVEEQKEEEEEEVVIEQFDDSWDEWE